MGFSVCVFHKLNSKVMKLSRSGVLNRGEISPMGKYWEFRGEMRAFENCCLFKTGDTKWFP